MLGLLPESSKVLFPGSRVLLEKKGVKVNLSAANEALLREIQFVAASDYPLERTSGAQSKDRRRSIKITAVVYGDTLFVVNDLFFGDNSAVISKLLQSLEVHTDNEGPPSCNFRICLPGGAAIMKRF